MIQFYFPPISSLNNNITEKFQYSHRLPCDFLSACKTSVQLKHCVQYHTQTRVWYRLGMWGHWW